MLNSLIDIMNEIGNTNFTLPALSLSFALLIDVLPDSSTLDNIKEAISEAVDSALTEQRPLNLSGGVTRE